jgi:hypothetical protein
MSLPSIYGDVELPDKLGELMAVAIADARAVVAAGHELDMSTWMSGRMPNSGKCVVCLAGAVMLNKSFGAGKEPPPIGVTPRMYPIATHHKLRAIDMLRVGNFAEAWALVEGKDFETEGPVAALGNVERNVGTTFHFDVDNADPDDVEQWWESMEMIRDELLKAGI